jgi:hypothetical protein
MATPFRFKRSAVKDKRPAISDLLLGEVALNTYDGRLFGRRTGTGSTVALLNPWSERLGAGAIYYEENVAIGASDPQGRKLFVDGNIAVTGVSTFTGAIDANGDLDVDGRTELDITNIAETLNVVGLSTFASNVDINASLDVDGRTELDITNIAETLNVTGISTFASAVDINADLNVSGVSTLTGNVSFGSSAFFGDDDKINMGDGDDLQIFHSGITGNIKNTTGTLILQSGTVRIQDAGSSETAFSATDGVAKLYFENSEKLTTNTHGIDVTGHTETDTLNVSGIATIHTLEVTDSATLKHAGQTKLTTTGIGISVANGIGQTAYIEGPDEIWIDPHPFGVGNTSGKVRIRGDLYVDGKEFIVDSGTIELNDFVVGIASTVPTNMLLDGAGIGIGSDNIRKFITYSNASDSLKSSENWNIAAGKHYEIDGVDVLTSDTLGDGVVNSSLTNVGTLTSLNVSGITTVGGTLDANGGLEANTAKIEDLTNDRVVLAGTGGELEDDANLTFNGTQLAVGVDLDVDGRTELDTTNIAETLNVVGITTLASAGGITTTGGDFYVGGDLYVLDDIVYDEVNGRNLNITGVGTFVELNVTGNVTLGDSSSDQINLNGRAFGHFIPANDDLFDLGSNTNRWQDLFLDGVADVDQLQVNVNGAVIDGSLTANTGVFLAMNTGSTVTIGGSFASNLIPSSDSTRDLGTTDVRWRTAFVDDINIGADLIVGGNIDLNGDLDVSGISTFASDVDINADLDVDGRTELDITNIAETLNVVGVSTFVGDGNFINNLTVGGDLNVTGDIVYDEVTGRNINITGISTFEGNTSIGVGGTVLFADTTVQRVGINSTIPGYALDVVGDINSSTDVKIGGVSILSLTASTDDVVALAIALG